MVAWPRNALSLHLLFRQIAHMATAITAEQASEGRKEIQKTVSFAGVGIGMLRHSWLQHNDQPCDVTRQI